MLKKTVNIGDREVTFKSSAAIPRMYRIKFGRDIFKDLTKLEKSYKDKDDGSKEMEIEDLEIFENVASTTEPFNRDLGLTFVGEAMKPSVHFPAEEAKVHSTEFLLKSSCTKQPSSIVVEMRGRFRIF